MDVETAYMFVASLIQNTDQPLNNLDRAIFYGSWNNFPYKTIATENGVKPSYIQRDAGPELWKKLSQVLHQKVTKKNFKVQIELALEKSNSSVVVSSFIPLMSSDTQTTIHEKVCFDYEFLDVTLKTVESTTQSVHSTEEYVFFNNDTVDRTIPSFDDSNTINNDLGDKVRSFFQYVILFLKLLIRLLSFRTLFPNLHLTLNKLAVDFQINNSLLKALIFYHLTIISEPNYCVNYSLGSLYEKQNKLTQAHREYKIAINKKRPRAYNNLARLYIEEGKYQEAIQLLEDGLQLATEREEYIYTFYKNLGRAYMSLGNYDEAKSWLNKSICVAPEKSAVAYGLLARMMEKLGKREEFLTFREKFLQYANEDYSPDVRSLKLFL